MHQKNSKIVQMSRFAMPNRNEKRITFPELSLDENDELLMLFSSKKQVPERNSPKSSSNDSMAILD